MSVIGPDKVALIHYILTDDAGGTIDSSRDADPMPYLHGAGNIVPGLEQQLEGKTVGDRVKAVVEPEDGYGPKSGADPQSIPLDSFPDGAPSPGMPVSTEDEDGNPIQLWVVDINDTEVMITPDHPLAGVTLHFDVQVMEVRDATPSELEHGHPHPGDGHSH